MKKNTGLYILLSFAAMLAIFFWMRSQGAPLKTPATPKGIIDLEFAWTQKNVEGIIAAWPGDTLTAAKNNIYIDFLFIIAYTSFLTLTCRWFAEKRHGSSGSFGLLGKQLSRFIPAAGAFDVAENALMLLSLQATPNNYTATITGIFAALKFFIAGLAVLYILLSLPFLAKKRWPM